MLVVVGYELHIHSYLDCCKSLDGVSALMLVIEFCTTPLGYTKKDLSIQEGHQSCWCKVLLHCSEHVGIVNQGNL